MTLPEEGSANGKAVEIFFVDGNPEGMRTASVFNWTGKVLIAPRTQIDRVLKRPEAQFAGVYILFGDNDGAPCVYVGQSTDIDMRIRQHVNSKGWWETAVLVTSSVNKLNKAHVMYLEARLVEIVDTVGSVAREKGNTPKRPELSEAEINNMEVFLEYTLLVLPAMGIDYFIQRTRPLAKELDGSADNSNIQRFELLTPKNKISANARLENGEFIVEAGSRARSNWTSRQSDHTYARLHAFLMEKGKLEKRDDPDSLTGKPQIHVFKEDYVFQSPSAAAAVVNGRPANGRTEWKIRGQDTTYEQWERDQLDSLQI